MATPLPGFAPGVAVTPVAGQHGGVGQVKPVQEIPGVKKGTTGVLVITNSGFTTLLTRYQKSDATIKSLMVANVTGTARTMKLRLRPNSASTGLAYSVVEDKSIAANSDTELFANKEFLIPAGHVLEAQASAATALNAVVQYEENLQS